MKVAVKAVPDNTSLDIIDSLETHKTTFINDSFKTLKADDSVINNALKKERSAPIGLFDSGVGGLSVYLHLAQQLPHERYVYYADTLHVPYGNRDSEDIKALTLAAVAWLYQQGCKLIVIACNSASAYALETARRYYPQLLIVGLVPALKPAVLASKTHHVAVNDVITNVAIPHATRVSKYFDPNLVPWVESGMPKDSKTAQDLRLQLQQFSQDGVDQLVLGCTHYPFFKAFLRQEITQQQLALHIVDSGHAIAERVKQLLIAEQLLALPVKVSANEALNGLATAIDIPPALTFYATKYDKQLGAVVRRLLGKQSRIQYILSP